MAKVIVHIPFIVWRDGRPRYVATPAHRALGYKGEDLRHPDGSWYSLDEAGAWSAKRSEEIAARRTAQAEGRRVPVARRAGTYTIGDLMRDWMTPALNPRFGDATLVRGKRTVKPLSPATRRVYGSCARGLQSFDGGRVWAAPVGELTRRAARAIWERLCEQKGIASARAILSALSAAWTWGEMAHKVGPSPMSKLQMSAPPPRIRVGSVDEMRALIATADALGRPEVGDAIMLGLMTGQRQADRLALTDGGTDLDSRLLIRQRKTGAVVLLPQAPALIERLTAARARRRAHKVQHAELVIDETARRPFRADHYRHVFGTIRAAAAAGVVREAGAIRVCAAAADGAAGKRMFPGAAVPDGTRKHPGSGTYAALVAAGAVPVLAPCPSLADFRDQDLRDTAVTWMALAGATIPEIVSVTGHSEQSATQILKHYLGRHPEMAASAIAKAASWVARKGL